MLAQNLHNGESVVSIYMEARTRPRAWLRALSWAGVVMCSLAVLATLAWIVAGTAPPHIAAAIVFFPVIHLALYLGYRLIKAGLTGLMGMAACLVSAIPAVVIGWALYSVLRALLGEVCGSIGDAQTVLYCGLGWLPMLTVWLYWLSLGQQPGQ